MKITFPMALLLLFIGLKLCNVIDWSWLWVLSPAWIPLALFFIVTAFLFVIAAFETPEQKASRLIREYAEALRRKP